jgi:hypothetical protein
MINETSFENNNSQWAAWRDDKPAYSNWLVKTIADRPERSHGFRYRGQYEAQVPGALKIAQES